MKLLITTIGLFIMISGFTCQLENDLTPEASVESKLLTSAPWKRVAATGQREGQAVEETWSNQLPCVKDNLYIFLANGKYASDEGPSKCFPEDPQYESKTNWSISEDGKILFIIESEDLGGMEFPYQIVELTATSLKLQRVLDKLTFTESYSH